MDWAEFWRSGRFTLWFILTLICSSLIWPFVPFLLGQVPRPEEGWEAERIGFATGVIFLVGAPFIVAAFLEIMLFGLLPAAAVWRVILPSLARLRLPAWLAAATSGLIAVGVTLLTIYLLLLLVREPEWLRRLLSPLNSALGLGGPVAIIVGPILAALLLREPFRKRIDTIRG